MLSRFDASVVRRLFFSWDRTDTCRHGVGFFLLLVDVVVNMAQGLCLGHTGKGFGEEETDHGPWVVAQMSQDLGDIWGPDWRGDTPDEVRFRRRAGEGNFLPQISPTPRSTFFLHGGSSSGDTRWMVILMTATLPPRLPVVRCHYIQGHCWGANEPSAELKS